MPSGVRRDVGARGGIRPGKGAVSTTTANWGEGMERGNAVGAFARGGRILMRDFSGPFLRLGAEVADEIVPVRTIEGVKSP